MEKEETKPIVQKKEINIVVKKGERNTKNIYKILFLKILPITLISITLISVAIHFHYESKKNIVNITNPVNSPTFIDSSNNNISLTYSLGSGSDNDCGGSIFTQEVTLTNMWSFNNINYDKYNVLVNLPDKNKLFLEEMPYGKEIKIGVCNEDKSNCCVYHKYRIENYKDILPCFIVNPSKAYGYYGNNATARAYSNPSQCYKAI